MFTRRRNTTNPQDQTEYRSFLPSRGFTLAEMLIALSIIGLLAGSVTITTGEARKKAQDALVKQNLSSIRSTAEEVYFTTYPNTYLPVCFDSMVDLVLKELGEATAVEAQNYQCLSSNEEWLAIFPLKQGGYWCSDGKGRSIPVDGFIEYSSPEYMDCTLAVADEPEVEEPPVGGGGSGSSATPVIYLAGAGMDPGSPLEIYSNSKNPFKGNAWHKYHEPGYSVTDGEDGDISNQIVVVGPVLTSAGGPKSCLEYNYEISYNVVNSGGIAASEQRRYILHRRCSAP